LAESGSLARLAERALALGAVAAAPLAASAVVVDERVTLKCRVPLCTSYGRNLMCPPAVMSPAETRAALGRYTDVLVVQLAIPLTQAGVDEDLGGRGYAEAHDAAGGLPGLRESQNALAGLMTGLERDAFKLGYRFAAALSGGECVLCEACVGQGSGEACRHPFAARPSMEAVGIDVVATARAAGLDVELPAAGDPRWTGLLLVD
jgi:predicted metal-binding protein